MNAPRRTIVLLPSHPWAFQPSMERETRNEVILSRREAGEADACDADEARFLRNDLNVAESTQDVDESPGEFTTDGLERAKARSVKRPHECHRCFVMRREPHLGQIHTGCCERGTGAVYSSRDVIR